MPADKSDPLWGVMRLIVLAFTLMVFAPPLAAEAQQTEKVWRVGILTGASRQASLRWGPFLEGLRELGYIEGRNLALEWRSSDGKAERLPTLALELARLDVDVIVAVDNPATAAAQRATRTIPIVMGPRNGPGRNRVRRQPRRPGGNITGLTVQATELQGKALQLLTEAVPAIARVAILWDPTERGREVQAREAEVAARALRLRVHSLPLRSADAIDGLFVAVGRNGLSAVLVQPSQRIFAHRTRIAELAARSRLPTMRPSRWFSDAGGLMSYAAADNQYWRAAYYVDRLLKGARAADLPIEQPTKFELTINLKTAKALGLMIPPTLVLRADRVLE